MKKRTGIIALATSIVFSFTASPKQQSVGLVLSGGGAKGVAHIGLIQALEENDIAIDYVAGTSMGAIVGGLYASGYSPTEMMQLITSKDFAYWSSGTIDPNLQYYFTTPPLSPKVISISVGNDSIAKLVPQSLISPLSMNFPFMELFSAETAACGGDFNNLFVPLRTVSSNIKAQRGEVARGGSMNDAIRASMSFPIVFCPVEINDTLHYDGGIFNNFPVDVMKADFHPDIMIGVDVHTEGPETPNVINQISELATRPQTYSMNPADGIHIHIDASRYSLLDFPQAREIYELGYKRGLEMVDSIKSRVTARRPQAEVTRRRREFRKRLSALDFSSIECEGGSRRQNDYIVAQFQFREGHEYNIDNARNGYYRAISGGKLQNLEISAVPADSGQFKIKLKAFPKSNWGVDIGGYISSSTSSMLYAALNYHNLNTRAIDASLGAWIGQSYAAAELLAKIRFGGKNPYSLGLQGVVSNHRFNQSERLFYQANEPKFVRNFQGFGRANLFSLPLG
ncbi:MAG: patatin-like phospholipase family protein, partial [Muribaculaceae bacterium]|nr:patatin-like phospholipase family protein [Muribaculaceae bacterium]